MKTLKIKGHDLVITDEMRKHLQNLWFIYGNNGKKHTHCNHRFIQNLIEHDDDTRLFYQKSPKGDLTDECIEAVDNMLLTIGGFQ